ncbi:DUF692 domain-containing protein [Legionella waltersii]|uniref:UPF0276 protein Lwal_1599 n=1 Tax=Legionella waltersii TaxID=66969 RepID=A0A0W1ABY1_9GAMM|nr:DUF692 domain-containing protein [Legionella waltersii]KTD78829.1 hypothetical protein Lwal_1599 [Legionella waltersii]SNV10928.1 Protein of uncharacterised function (DUF692) [Legionella waltersii]
MIKKPFLGFGLGLRTQHYEDILSAQPEVDWFEIITENYLVPGGKPLYYLNQIAERYPLVMHGVSMSIGSKDPLDLDYLQQVKRLAKEIKSVWISDHLCWTGVHGKNSHDLLPLPYTEETINHVAQQISQVQDYLEQTILIENVSSYLTYQQSQCTEWEFLTAIVQKANCSILLDVNNIYVSSVNHEFDPLDYLYGIPKHAVAQVHLAGHCNMGNYIIDTHDHPIIDPVWNLYSSACTHFGEVSTMIERDDNIPPLSELLSELDHARKIANQSNKVTQR